VTDHKALLGVLLAIYMVAMIGIAWWARSRIHDAEDYIVAGRRLSVSLAAATLLATWFGAGALLTATDEVRRGGLRMAALDPLGAGICLLLAGLWLARPLWNMRLLTLGDFYGRRFGPTAELTASVLMVPTYFGWVAAQFVALAGLFELVFGLPASAGIAIVAVVGTSYTLLGGMWSVTLTDVVQMAFVVVGLLVLTAEVLFQLGGGVLGGLQTLAERVPAEKLVLVPRENAGQLIGWLGVLAVGAFGNLPGQDLLQRVFASRSEGTAVRACYWAGGCYLLLGFCPLVLGLAGDLLAPGHENASTIGLLSTIFLSPWSGSLLLLAVVSAVLSTIDSAILSPASLLAQNVFPRIVHAGPEHALARNRRAVVLIAVCSVITAYLGESAYRMLEDAYALAMVSLLVPLLAGVWFVRGGERAAMAAMTVGTVSWLLHRVAGWDAFLAPVMGDAAIPVAAACTGLSMLAFGLGAWADARS